MIPFEVLFLEAPRYRAIASHGLDTGGQDCFLCHAMQLPSSAPHFKIKVLQGTGKASIKHIRRIHAGNPKDTWSILKVGMREPRVIYG